jgi:hypothetical protein
MSVSATQPKRNEMLTIEEREFKAQNVHDVLGKYLYDSKKITDVNDILKDFKVSLQDVREYEKETNKKLIRFGINHDKRYKPFYQSILNLKEEYYFVYGLLAQIFRQNLRKDEEGKIQITYMSLEAFRDCFEKNYQEEMKFIKRFFCVFPVTYESLYMAYLLLEESFVERYCLMYSYCLHRS